MRKMSRNALTLLAGLIIAAFGATPALAATSGPLYGINFEDPPHKADQLPAIGVSGDPAPRVKISSIFAGNPTVVNGLGALTSQVLKFDANDGGDQIRLLMTDFSGGLPAGGFYAVKSEILIAVGAAAEFVFFIDAPEIRRIGFKPDGTIRVCQPPFAPGPLVCANDFQIGTFTHGSKFILKVLVDLAADNWKIFLDDVLLHDGSFGGATAISTIRFSRLGSSNTIAAIDNVFVSVAFGPPPPTELAACSLAPATLEAHCLASGPVFSIFHSQETPFSLPEDCACPAVNGQPAVVSVSCVDVPGAAGACFDPTEDVVLTTPSGIEIFNVEGGIGTHISTVYCYAIDGIRICQEFTLVH